MWRARMAALALAAALLASGCSFAELLEFVDESAQSTDLTSPEQPPDVNAAGRSASEAENEDDARRLAEQAIEEHDLDAAEEAKELRPRDPRYPLIKVVLLVAEGNPAPTSEVALAKALVEAANPGESERELNRISGELYMDALHDLYASYPRGSEQSNKLKAGYCYTLRLYDQDLRTPPETRTPETELFWNVYADRQLCGVSS